MIFKHAPSILFKPIPGFVSLLNSFLEVIELVNGVPVERAHLHADGEVECKALEVLPDHVLRERFASAKLLGEVHEQRHNVD